MTNHLYLTVRPDEHSDRSRAIEGEHTRYTRTINLREEMVWVSPN